ncbi:hypothetical protein D3C87_1611320 [compost metagenome]
MSRSEKAFEFQTANTELLIFFDEHVKIFTLDVQIFGVKNFAENLLNFRDAFADADFNLWIMFFEKLRT